MGEEQDMQRERGVEPITLNLTKRCLNLVSLLHCLEFNKLREQELLLLLPPLPPLLFTTFTTKHTHSHTHSTSSSPRTAANSEKILMEKVFTSLKTDSTHCVHLNTFRWKLNWTCEPNSFTQNWIHCSLDIKTRRLSVFHVT